MYAWVGGCVGLMWDGCCASTGVARAVRDEPSTPTLNLYHALLRSLGTVNFKGKAIYLFVCLFIHSKARPLAHMLFCYTLRGAGRKQHHCVWRIPAAQPAA